ncbi:DUF551 domain-containing protein [Citrobacter braakii]|uniref:DUF551 domain-containing protein n=1 Tax=Citrobacter braakii TaxID=57706 RepID=UPI002B248E90|nr:DUF551 domain-containing protein [Citrobacter braakii]MEB1006808.1 DUF551 domain-containing protein [Citrobacter braakii]
MTTNHPAHGPVSLDRLHQISEILSKASAQSDGGNLGYAMADAVKVIDEAIAAFGAEPVAIAPVMYKGIELLKKDGLELIRDGIAEATELESMCMAEALLSVQTDLVVPPKIEPDYEVITAILPTANPDEYACCIAADMWNACRAAMLQAGNSPVTPDCWIPVIERMPERDVYVQLYCADSREQMVGYMEREESEGYFRFSTWRSGKGIYCKPTHWMPLPAAPQQEVKS